MDTTETVLLIVVGSLLSIFIALCCTVAIVSIKLVNTVREVAEKASDVVDSVESAAEVLKDTSGRLAFFKLIKNIIKFSQKGKK